MNRASGLTAVSLLAIAMVGSSAHGEPLNIIFFGNSFTYQHNVDQVVRTIATAAGHATPVVHREAPGGQTLAGHISTLNSQGMSSMLYALPAGQSWNYVVMQEYSTRPTQMGDPLAFRGDAVTLHGMVDNHSPGVNAVLYETWAREGSIGSPFYPTPFANPAAMQAELRDNYALAAGDINFASGGAIAQVAGAGSAWEHFGWTGLHADDKWHASPRGALLSALVIYGTIYQDNSTSNIDLTSVLSSMGLALSASERQALTAAADAIITVPEPASLSLLVLAGVLGLRRRGSARR
jgi:hypothetical protein